MSPDLLTKPWKILVVDDDEVDRLVVRRALKQADVSVDVHESEDVASATQAIREGDFDCALVDYHLPDGDGRDILAVIRRNGHRLPVVMVTGHGDNSRAIELMKEGAYDYLTKGSFESKELIRTIHYAMSAHRAQMRERENAALHRALAEAGERFGGTLDYRATVNAVVDLFVPHYADSCHIQAASDVPGGGSQPGACRTHDAESGDALGGEHVFERDLSASGRELGRLRLERREPRGAFSTEEVDLICHLSDRAAAALDSARLFGDLHDESAVVAALNRVGRALAGTLDPSKIAETVVREGMQLTGASVGALYQPADPGGRPGVFFRAGSEHDTSSDAMPPDGAGARWLSAVEGARSAVRYGADDLDHPFASGDALGSYLAVPVATHEGECAAGLFFGHPDPGTFRDRARTLAEGIAAWAGVALGNAELFREARAAVQARDEVIGIVSHDLRNPLNAILFTTAMLLDMDLDPEVRREQLGRIRRSGTRMNRLIQDLLDVTRIEAGGLSVDLDRVALADVLVETQEMMVPLADERGSTLVVDLPDDDVDAFLDRERVVQLFGNLIGNSLKFTPGGGEVRFGGRRIDDRVELFVSDNGPGIPSDQIHNLFDRFWQGTERRKEGAGLGLPICKGIAEAHGGSIDVDTSPAGTTFTVRMPVRPRGV